MFDLLIKGGLVVDGTGAEPVIADVAARFSYPDYARLDDNPPRLARARKEDPAFAAWKRNDPPWWAGACP